MEILRLVYLAVAVVVEVALTRKWQHFVMARRFTCDIFILIFDGPRTTMLAVSLITDLSDCVRKGRECHRMCCCIF